MSRNRKRVWVWGRVALNVWVMLAVLSASVAGATPLSAASPTPAAATPTATPSPSATAAPALATVTSSPTVVAPASPTAAPSQTAAPSASAAVTPPALLATATATPPPAAASATATSTASATAVAATAAPSASAAPSAISTPGTAVPGATASASATPTSLATGTATASPTQTVSTGGLVELPLVDQSSQVGRTYQYRTVSPAGYILDVFEQGREVAGVRLEHPQSGASLGFELLGVAQSRTASGAVAVARVGSVTARWTSYVDRLKEELALAARPAGDQVVFALAQQGLAFGPDGQGGYLARDPAGLVRFRLLAPTLEDARGRPGAATLTLDLAQGTATIRLAPAFLATAAYPLRVDPTVTYADEVQADNPLAYWRLGEASGTTAFDSSPNGSHGTLTGGVTLGRPGALYGDPDTAMGFDGVNDYIALPSGFSTLGGGATLEAWIYPTSNANWSRIVVLSNGSGGDGLGLLRRSTSTDLRFGVVDAPNVLVLNQWQHVAGTIDAAGNVAIYHNGRRVGTGTMAVPRNVTRTVNYIARSDYSGDAYFKGSIDEVAV